MKRILHIIKDPNNKKPFELIQSQAGKNGQTEIRLVLLQEAVRLYSNFPADFPASVYVLEEDLAERGLSSSYQKIDYSRLLDLIFNSESVINW
jgi:sulfur transfer complex TusBCD TusB component (DsrH family)